MRGTEHTRMSADKIRIDLLLVERGLVPSREVGRKLIMAGEVLVNGQRVDKPGTRIPADAQIVLKSKPRYVSRGGYKLEAALDAFGLDVGGMICADVGASTGGFTDCLLQRGAARIYAIDVGYGQLAHRLRRDGRVIVMERTNARYLEALPEPVDLVTIDASFISLRLLLPVIRGWLRERAYVLPLIKPQFEAGREHVGKGGVVRSPEVHRAVLTGVLGFASERGMIPRGLIRSPLKGPAGNIEFLALLSVGDPAPASDLGAMIEQVMAE